MVVWHDHLNPNPAENRDKRARGASNCFAQVRQLLFHQQACRGLLHESSYTDDGRVRPMSRTECIANEHSIAQRGELFGETFLIFFPTNHRLMRSFLCVAKMVRAITRLRIIV